MLKEKLIQSLKNTLREIGINNQEIELKHPNNPDFGDYSSNIALKKSKPLKTPPMDLGLKISSHLKKDNLIEKVEVVEPGFINFWLAKTVLLQEAKKIIESGNFYGQSTIGQGKTVIIDYSSPNIAKRFSVGHLRSTIIGQAVYNLFQFLGYRVIGDNHIGDWGTQFGKLIIAIKKWSQKPGAQLTIDDLEKLYIKFHQEAKKDPALEVEARKAFRHLEEGKKLEKQLWSTMVKKSMAEFQKIYKILGIKIDLAYGESFYEPLMKTVIKEALDKKIAVRSQGALIIPFKDKKLPPAILLKKDGATTYFTRDLATIKFRQQNWNPDLIIYEVGSEQKLHFKQLFLAAEKLGYGKKKQFVHLAHGLIRLKTGKMSTRQGQTIKLEDLLKEAIKQASRLNPDPKIAQIVGVGAIKYNDLKRNPQQDYIFDWKEALSLEGNSGPYLQYTYARCKSVLKKTKQPLLKKSLAAKDLLIKVNQINPNPEEEIILRTLYKFPEIVLQAAGTYSPNLLAHFLFDLAQKYNLFYQKHLILHPQKETKAFRLLLTQATAQVIKNGLKLLGIATLEKM